MPREGVSRITADIPTSDAARLEKIAERIHSTKTTALIRSLRTSEILENAAARGEKIEIVAKDGTRREIVLP